MHLSPTSKLGYLSFKTVRHHCQAPRTKKALSFDVERQILGVKISALVIHMWHAHSKRLDAALKTHNAPV